MNWTWNWTWPMGGRKPAAGGRRAGSERWRPWLGFFWPAVILALGLFAAVFFVAFDYYLVPVRTGQITLEVVLRNGAPEASAKAQAYAVSESLKGTVDDASLTEGKLHIAGWAVDDDDPDSKPLVLVFLDNRLVGSAVARLFRPDLLMTFNLKNGSLGFEGNFEAGTVRRTKGHKLRVVAMRLKPAVTVNELVYGPDVHFETIGVGQ
jgi:hypothetical protein